MIVQKPTVAQVMEACSKLPDSPISAYYASLEVLHKTATRLLDVLEVPWGLETEGVACLDTETDQLRWHEVKIGNGSILIQQERLSSASVQRPIFTWIGAYPESRKDSEYIIEIKAYNLVSSSISKNFEETDSKPAEKYDLEGDESSILLDPDLLEKGNRALIHFETVLQGYLISI